MTEFSPDQDELASAYLDGEVTDDERALVDADPELLARVDALRAVRDALSEPSAPPSRRDRDAAIAAALRAAPVVDLRAERARRRLRIASIAAAIVVAVGAAGVLVRLAPSSSSKKSTATAAAGGSRAPAAESDASAQAADGAAANIPGAFSLASREPLGDFTDRTALTDAAKAAVRNRLSVDHTKQAATASVAAPNAGADRAEDTPAPVLCTVPLPANAVVELYGATASLQGRAIQLDVFSLTDDTLLLVVTDTAGCTQLFTQSV